MESAFHACLCTGAIRSQHQTFLAHVYNFVAGPIWGELWPGHTSESCQMENEGDVCKQTHLPLVTKPIISARQIYVFGNQAFKSAQTPPYHCSMTLLFVKIEANNGETTNSETVISRVCFGMT